MSRPAPFENRIPSARAYRDAVTNFVRDLYRQIQFAVQNKTPMPTLPKAKPPKVSKYEPHQGKRECARRLRRIAAGVYDEAQLMREVKA